MARYCVVLCQLKVGNDVVAVLSAGEDNDYDSTAQSMPEEAEYLLERMLGVDDAYGWIVVGGVSSMDEAAAAALEIAEGPW